jgi:hypothetical protein
MITNKGKALWAAAIGNLNNGYTGTVTSATPTKLKAAGGPKWVAEQFTGQDVFAGGFVGTILSNNETELTVARWEKLPNHEHEAFNRAEEAPEAPAASAAYYIASGTTPAAWMAVSANAEEPKATNETLAGEIGVGKTESSKFGLVRKLAKFTYLGPGESNKYKVEVTFTAGTEDSVPVTLAKIGVFNAQNGGTMMFESLLTATAEIKSVGDSVTITDVVVGS